MIMKHKNQQQENEKQKRQELLNQLEQAIINQDEQSIEILRLEIINLSQISEKRRQNEEKQKVELKFQDSICDSNMLMKALEQIKEDNQINKQSLVLFDHVSKKFKIIEELNIHKGIQNSQEFFLRNEYESQIKAKQREHQSTQENAQKFVQQFRNQQIKLAKYENRESQNRVNQKAQLCQMSIQKDYHFQKNENINELQDKSRIQEKKDGKADENQNNMSVDDSSFMSNAAHKINDNRQSENHHAQNQIAYYNPDDYQINQDYQINIDRKPFQLMSSEQKIQNKYELLFYKFVSGYTEKSLQQSKQI